ncbi:MAG: hypothetical protein AB7E52_02605, partial [Bdellovibrionales bacterium]
LGVLTTPDSDTALAVAGKIKSVSQSNAYSVSAAVMNSMHPDCNMAAGYASSTNLMSCMSACNRFCRTTYGYSGGTIGEWAPPASGSTAFCVCSP